MRARVCSECSPAALRFASQLWPAAVIGAAIMLGGSHWINDPAFDNHDLSDYLCGADAPPNSTSGCPELRNCTFDAELASYAALNATCGAEGGCYVCLHKSLWPLAPGDGILAAVLFLAQVLAGASGIGGGGLNVPLLMLSGGFLVSEAVPLSHVAVLCAARPRQATILLARC